MQQLVEPKLRLHLPIFPAAQPSPPRPLRAAAPPGQAPPARRYRRFTRPSPAHSAALPPLTQTRPSHCASAPLAQTPPIRAHFRPADQPRPSRRASATHPNRAHPAALPLRSSKPRPPHRTSAPPAGAPPIPPCFRHSGKPAHPTAHLPGRPKPPRPAPPPAGGLRLRIPQDSCSSGSVHFQAALGPRQWSVRPLLPYLHLRLAANLGPRPDPGR